MTRKLHRNHNIHLTPRQISRVHDVAARTLPPELHEAFRLAVMTKLFMNVAPWQRFGTISAIQLQTALDGALAQFEGVP